MFALNVLDSSTFLCSIFCNLCSEGLVYTVRKVTHFILYISMHYSIQWRESLTILNTSSLYLCDTMKRVFYYIISLYTLLYTVKRVTKRREHAFGGDEVQQTENMLQKEAFRTLKLAKAKVRWAVSCDKLCVSMCVRWDEVVESEGREWNGKGKVRMW